MTYKELAGPASLALFAWIAFASSNTPDGDSLALSTASPNIHVAGPNITVPKILGPPALAPAPPPQTKQQDDDALLSFGEEQFQERKSDSCSDSIANCNDPIKYLGTVDECACFACAYGTPGQRTVCTKNAADKKALFNRRK